MYGRPHVARLRSRMDSEQRGRNPPTPAGETADGPAAETRSAVSVTETSEAGTTEQRLDTVVSEARVPTWVWVVLGALGIAMVAVTLGLFVEARDASSQAEAASASASELMDRLIADVQTTNKELSTFNEQFESATTSAQAAVSSAQAKKEQSKRSTPNEQSP